MKRKKLLLYTAILVGYLCFFSAAQVEAYYTTRGQDVIDRKTSERVILQGFGIGCWLLPEGYMWRSGSNDRPRLIEQAIETNTKMISNKIIVLFIVRSILFAKCDYSELSDIFLGNFWGFDSASLLLT